MSTGELRITEDRDPRDTVPSADLSFELRRKGPALAFACGDAPFEAVKVPGCARLFIQKTADSHFWP